MTREPIPHFPFDLVLRWALGGATLGFMLGWLAAGVDPVYVVAVWALFVLGYYVKEAIAPAAPSPEHRLFKPEDGASRTSGCTNAAPQMPPMATRGNAVGSNSTDQRPNHGSDDSAVAAPIVIDGRSRGCCALYWRGALIKRCPNCPDNQPKPCEHLWTGSGPMPAKWHCACGTLVFRSYEDYSWD